MNRRRFLSITAAAVATPSLSATPVRWQGRALGAEVSLTLYAPDRQGNALLEEVKTLLLQVETEFSLFDPQSALSRLNRTGRLTPSGRFLRLMALADQAHHATGGLFDPTVQPLWGALARGENPEAARAHLGWDRLRLSPSEIVLDPGQALTFNGIAQGFATDLVRDHLTRAGLTHALINVGEFAAIGGPFRLGMADPEHGLMSVLHLTDRAVATSSPNAQKIGKSAHILHPKAQKKSPLWSTVSVTCDSAALADAASTAFCLMSEEEIGIALGKLDGTPRASLVTHDGHLIRVHRSSGG